MSDAELSFLRNATKLQVFIRFFRFRFASCYGGYLGDEGNTRLKILHTALPP